MGPLEILVQVASVRPDILHFDTIGVEACFGGEYLNVAQSDIVQDLFYIKIQTITDNDQAEALAPTAGYNFVET